jgi:inner membrane protein
VLLPVLCAAVVMLVDRWRPPAGAAAPGVAARARWWPLLLLSYVGVLSHVFLDYLNNYGVRLLSPWSNQWFYGDTLFIVDPWLWLALGFGVRLARRRAQVQPARLALAFSVVYIVVMLASASAARTAVAATWRGLHGHEPQALMVGPTFADPFGKQVIVDRGDSYEQGTFRWIPYGLHLDPQVVPKGAEAPASVVARAAPDVQALLLWARFPYYERETTPSGSRIVVSDMRFGRFVAAASAPGTPTLRPTP